VDFFSNLSLYDVFLFYVVAILIGMAKTGVQGAGMLSVPVLASVFGGQMSSGVLLPVLCLADIMGLWYYHRHADWSRLTRLIPFTITGTIVGAVVGTVINDYTFRIIMATAILGSVLLLIVLETKKRDIPHGVFFSAVAGFAAGFTSMVGNLAGPLMAVYFLSMRLPKNEFIGTTAWFFLIINFLKVPLHIFFWKTISFEIFVASLTTIPLLAAGAFLGVVIVRRISERNYRWFIIVMTLGAAVFMIMS
jgi:uncharacterized protein